jgi:hypothetical protein
MIWILFGDDVTTIDFTLWAGPDTDKLYGNGGVDYTPQTGDAMICRYIGVNWWCSIIKGRPSSAHIVDATNAADVITRCNAILAALEAQGILALS